MIFFRNGIVAIALTACSIAYAVEPSSQRTISEIIPITEANLLGHKSLYKEGWFIVSSSEKAFSYAKEHSIKSSGQAMLRAISDTKRNSAKYAADLSDAGEDGLSMSKDILKVGTELTELELWLTGELIKSEWDYGSHNMNKAWQRFVTGNMTLAARTSEDRAALATLPGGWYKDIRSDFSNISELTHAATSSMSPHIEGRWSDAMDEAHEDFMDSYEKSATRSNSLSALGDILFGYSKAAYSGLVKPMTRSTVQGARVTVKGVSTVVFLPVVAAFIVTGRTIQSTGLSLYYTTSLGVKLVSPTVEGGLLTGLSMLSYGAIPVTAAVGGTVGVVNQIAVTTISPVAGATTAVVVGAAETGAYAAQVSYDLIKGVTKVTLNQAQSGIVLGYNALTALPTQLLLGSANSIVFLAYDGPRLVVASVKGEVQWSNKSGEISTAPVQSLPVGSVVDLSAISKEPGIHVKILSDDPDVVHKVLEKLSEDLRSGDRS